MSYISWFVCTIMCLCPLLVEQNSHSAMWLAILVLFGSHGDVDFLYVMLI